MKNIANIDRHTLWHWLGLMALLLGLSACSDSFRQPENNTTLADIFPQEQTLHFDTHWRISFSENQHFSINLPKGYALFPEEPRSDVVLLDNNEHAMMRVEIFPQNTADLSTLIEDSQRFLQADGRAYNPLNPTIVAQIPLKNLHAWQTQKIKESQLMILLYVAGKRYVRLTIFDADPQRQLQWLQIATSLIPLGINNHKENP